MTQRSSVRPAILAAALFAALIALCPACSDNTSGGSATDGGWPGISDAAATPVPAPDVCDAPVAPADVSRPDSVVGDGTPASCTEAALDAALARGGVIVFRCGGGPHTLLITSEKILTKPIVLDGGGLIKLSGGGTTRILSIPGIFSASDISVTLQNLRFTRAKAAGSGAAVLKRGNGKLTIIGCHFDEGTGPVSGQDLAGGAVYAQGGDTVISGSVFTANSSSNGGAIGVLRSNLILYNSLFERNTATGSGGNPGSGGNGGAIYVDGLNATVGKRLEICGSVFVANQAGSFGGALFRYGYANETAAIDRSTFDGNAIETRAMGLGGGIYLQNGAFRLTASTISNNAAHGAGGLFVHGDPSPGTKIEFTNLTIAANRAVGTLGGGITFSGSVSGTVLNATIVGNRAFFGGGISGGGPVLKNSIVADNLADEPFNAINCTVPLSDGGGNIQWPIKRPNGSVDFPERACSSGATAAAPLVSDLADNGGPTRTMALQPQSAAINKGSGCPATDQRGLVRGSSCDSGAMKY
jgi:hypothetical protein